MKRSKLLLVLVLALVAVMALVACDKTPVHEHAYGGWTIETAPTASAEGTATRKCACGEKETATLANLSDTSVWTVSNNVPATHTQDGCTVYTSQYGTVVVTLGKLADHKHGAWEITAEPDLTTAGKAKRTCECGDSDEVEVPALENANVWKKENVARASHDEEGLVRYTSVYGTVEKTVAKGEHSWSSWKIVTAPTAIKKGEAAKFCTTDGCKSTETAELPVLTDTTVWTASVTAATCTTPEITTYTSLYGTVTVETAAANGHNFQVSAINEPKCTEKGSATFKCTVCGCEETKEIAALGHDFSGAFVPYIVSAYEDESGGYWGIDYDGSQYHAQKCSRCGVYDAAHKQAHTYEGGEVSFIIDKIEGSSGNIFHHVSAKRACTACGYKSDFDKNWRNLEDWTKGDTVEATYTSAGYTEYTTIRDDVTYTYRLPIAKLVAPYDGKTYTAADVDFKTEPDALSKCDKIDAFITLDETGKGTGTAFPFKGDVSVTMVDPATGKIRFASDGNTYDGYVDMETGIIAYFGLYNKVYILSPFDSANSEYKASQFALSRAIEYTPECNIGDKHTFKMFVTDDRVYFGVRFNNGTADISANECFEAENLVVFDKDGNKIKGFKKVDGTTTALDGYEGTYTNSEDATESVVIDGIGGLVINGTINGVYTKAADADYFEVYVVDGSGVKTAYYHVTISGNAYTKVAKTATIHYSSSEEGTVAPADETVSANVVITLATMSNTATKIFKGWRRTGSEEIITTLTPEIDEVINLEAVWTNEVKISVKDGVGGDKELTAGVGDTLSSILPAYETEKTVSSDKTKYFVCWYIDANSNGAFDAGEAIEVETEISAADNGITVVANWADSCVLAGTYYGTEIYYKSSGNSSVKTLSISESGKISGVKTGKVVEYDAKTGKITWRASGNETDKYFWYDAENGIFAGLYKDADIGDDYYLFTTALTEKNFKANATFGVKPVGKTSCLLQFANVNTINGNKDVLMYNNTIYSDIIITKGNGTALAVADIKNSNTLVVKNAKTNEIIVALASEKENFDADGATKNLDAVFGTYTCEGQDNLVLDGVGNFVWGSKNGTYTIKDAAKNIVEAYVVVDGANTEYYHFTLDVTNGTYVVVMPTATITVVVPDGQDAIAPIVANINIKVKLPTTAKEGYSLVGYYTDSAFGESSKIDMDNYIVTKDETIYAKYNVSVSITYHFNNGSDNKVVVYPKDALNTVQEPEKDGYIFVGWFTDDETFANKWNEVADSTKDVYAKWVIAPYAHTYTFVYYSYSFNSTYAKAEYAVSFNARGEGTFARTDKKEILPFDGCTSTSYYTEGSWYDETTVYTGYRISIVAYDFETYKVTFKVEKVGKSTSQTFTYYGYVDPETGIIVADYNKKSETFEKFAMFLPEGYSSETATKWDNKYLLSYTNGTAKMLFIDGGNIYLNAKVVDKNGNNVSSKDAAKAPYIAIYNKQTDAEPAYVLGYNGSTLVAFDGYEGEYTYDTDKKLTVNGLGNELTINGKSAKYTAIGEDGKTTATIDGVYYEITLHKDTKTAEVVAPKATVNYVFEHATLDGGNTVQQGIKVKFALPTLTIDAGYQFVGWYTESNYLNKVTEYTLQNTDEITFYARVEAVPDWAAKETAPTVNYTDNVVISGETNELNGTYYTKLIVTEAGNYYFLNTSVTKKGGNGTTSYARFSILNEDGTICTNGKALSFGSYSPLSINLEAGTYYIETNLGGKVSGSSYTYNTYGTFTMTLLRGTHDTAETAIDYTLGEKVTVVEQTGKNKINTVYKVVLEADKTYKLSNISSSYSKIYIYSDTQFKSSIQFTTGTSTSGFITNGKDGTFKCETSGVYYIVTSYSLDFTLEEVTE